MDSTLITKPFADQMRFCWLLIGNPRFRRHMGISGLAHLQRSWSYVTQDRRLLQNLSIWNNIFFSVVLRFAFRTLCLLCRHSSTWATSPALFTFYFYFFGGTGNQGFTLAKLVLYSLSHTSSPLCSGYFGDGEGGSWEISAHAGFEPWSLWSHLSK
jgi:hypothetical protein